MTNLPDNQYLRYDAILVRHGTAEDDADDRLKRIRADAAFDLTAAGRAEIRAAAQLMRGLYATALADDKPGFPFTILTDDSNRCVQSAGILKEALGAIAAAPEINPGLRTWNQGRFAGCTDQEKQAIDSSAHHLMKHGTPLQRYHVRPPEGESLAEVVERMRSVHEALVARAQEKPFCRVILVTHQVPGLAFMHLRTGAKAEDFPDRVYNPRHASVIRIAADGAAVYLHGSPQGRDISDISSRPPARRGLRLEGRGPQ